MAFVFMSSLMLPVPLFKPLTLLVAILPSTSPASAQLPDSAELQARLRGPGSSHFSPLSAQ